MPDARHRFQSALLGVHPAHRYVFADAADRVAFTNEASGNAYNATAPTAADVGSLARQLDDESFWVLQATGPITWANLTSTGGVPPDNSVGDTQIDKVTPANVARKTLQLSAARSIPLATGQIGNYVYIPADLTVLSWSLVANVSGSIEFDVWVVNDAGFPPTVANTIVGSAPPALVAAQRLASSVLTGWTVNLTFGNWLAYAITSTNSVIQSALLQLHCRVRP